MQDRESDVQEGIRARSRQTVRRKLFQDDDDSEKRHISTGIDDNLNNHLFEESKKELEKKTKRWNFDFEKEEPLPGRWEWSKVDSKGIENSQERNVENGQATMISKNQETDNSEATPQDRENSQKSDIDLNNSSEN